MEMIHPQAKGKIKEPQVRLNQNPIAHPFKQTWEYYEANFLSRMNDLYIDNL